jgi:hypothetical protein
MRTAAGVGLVMILGVSRGHAEDAARRKEISDRGKALFLNTSNHCKALADLSGFAASKADDVPTFFEDMKLVMIGEDLDRRGTGAYYIGGTRGARGDTGFKKELRDGSPQAEHAFAAIYLGKLVPPGAANIFARLVEARGGELNNADTRLYDIGMDLGARVMKANLAQVPQVIMRTMCE